MTTLSTAPTTASPDRAPFRALLEAQRADCVRQRELALAETATSVPDPVAQGRAAGLLRTIEEIDAALQRIAAGTYGACVHCGATGELGAQMAYVTEIGTVVRCSSCEGALIRIVRQIESPQRYWLDLKGVQYLQFQPVS